MLSDSDRIRDVYERAALDIAQLVGAPEFGVPPTVDVDQLPASVVVAGRNALMFLATAVGILDPDAEPCDGISADEYLARVSAEAPS